MLNDTSNVESVSDVDDFDPSFLQKVSDYCCLTPVHGEVYPFAFVLTVGSDFPVVQLDL
jgi:hypothetical protein